MLQTKAQPVEKGLSADNTLERMLAYNVDDINGERIGHVSGLWLDPNNQVEFVGVRTTWLVGKTHVFPARGMEVNHHQEIIRAPYPVEIVKNAPAFDPGEELSEAQQREIFSYYRQHGLERFEHAGRSAESRGTAKREEARIALAEEELKIGKRQVEAGGVRLRKVVRTEPVQQSVELRREEIQIERVPAGQTTRADTKFQSEDIFIPLRREEAVVQKEPRVREEVRVSKKGHTEKQTVSERVRKEELETTGTRSSDEKQTGKS